MNKPFLFIETPRAGKHNHRFIIPTDYKDGDSLLSQFADTARKQPEAAGTIISTKGIYFLATGKEASQTSGGRIGWEQLILVNVDVKRLSPEKIANINSFLQQHLEKVELLVTETIDWNKIDTIIVPREELNQWLKELEKKVGTLPTIQQPPKPVIKQPTKPVIWIIAAMIGLCCIVIAFNGQYQNLYSKNTKTSEKNSQEQSATAKLDPVNKQAERLIKAIGGNEINVKNELGFPKDDKDLDNWKSTPAGKMPATGDWQLKWFTSSLDNEGRDLTQLWEQPIENLVIKDKDSALQPLVQCRIAIRNLMDIKEAVHTPFFKPEDFGEATNSFTALSDKIYEWTDRAHPDALKALGCDTKPKSSENLLHWIENCVEPIGKPVDDKKLKIGSVKDKELKNGGASVKDKELKNGGVFLKDKKLQNIKKVGEQCGAVFISPTVSNTNTIKNGK